MKAGILYSAVIILILAVTSAVAVDTVIIHRVDDFITPGDLKKGVAPADRDAPRVPLPHKIHEKAGLECAQCHHKDNNEPRVYQCAKCHKGNAGIDMMHTACVDCHAKNGSGPAECSGCHKQKETELTGLVRFNLYDIVRGPFLWVAFLVFALGCYWRVTQLIKFTWSMKHPMSHFISPDLIRTSIFYRDKNPFMKLWFRLKYSVRKSVFGWNPVMGAVSSIFHVLLFTAPLTLPAHNILFDEAFRISFITLPEKLIDRFAVVIAVIILFFLLRRIFYPRVRMISTWSDFGILLMVAAPFITGYIAYHQLADYRSVILAHMLTGEIVIMAIPFTRLGHMPFFLFARFFISSEYTLGVGNRRW